MTNFNKTQIGRAYLIELKVFGDKKGDEYAI